MNEIVSSLQTPVSTGPWILDGGLATALERRGHRLDSSLWSGEVLRHDPASVMAVHQEFLHSGANIITTASYQLASLEAVNDIETLWQRSIDVARQAAKTSDHPVAVAASIGPYGATLPGGQEYVGNYDAPAERLFRFHRERLRFFAAGTADLLAIETIPQHREALVLAELLGQQGKPAWISLVCSDATHLANGDDLATTIQALDKMPGVTAIGVNCVPPTVANAALKTIREHTSKPLLAYPNSGEGYATGHWDGSRDTSPLESEGLWAVGGCCRVYPEDIAAIARSHSR